MKVEEQDYIDLKGVRVNNLKNISLQIPRNQLVVITGLSGSGKSSLAFDTLYAEGQRRYVESLSVYARQFVSKMAKPEADSITGIPPAVAIEQRKFGKNQRSTVGTSTEVYDYLRMLYARVGHTFSPISGKEVVRHTTKDVINFIYSLPEGMRYMVCAPMTVPRGRPLKEHLELMIANGYSRVLVNDEVKRLQDLVESKGVARMKKSGMHLVVDRLVVKPDDDATTNRLGDSLETAFFEGDGHILIVYDDVQKEFSDRFEADGMIFEEPTDKLFSFNHSVGACPTCEGFGMVMGIDEDLVIPDKRLSLYEESVMCWRGPKMSQWQKDFIRKTRDLGFPIHRPYNELTEEEHDLLWYGDKEKRVYGIYDFFDHIEKRQYKMHYRIMLARFRGRSLCPTCKGKRLKKEAFYVKVAGKDISQLVVMPVSELRVWLDELQLNEYDTIVATRIMGELRHRVALLDEIGLGYLTLDRVAGTLSGGESQRITLATSLGGGLIGALYILDEPSIGLHPRDTHLLIDIVKKLTAAENTVVVVEHDEEMMRAADLLIDLGPEAGEHGGEVVFMGAPDQLPTASSKSHTVAYLTGKEQIEWPERRRRWSRAIQVKDVYQHNLKHLDVTFPLEVITVVTGVSGSGKSSLVRDVFYSGLQRKLDHQLLNAIRCQDITGNLSKVNRVEYIDQDSISTSTRSNPVTYIGTFDSIRKLMADQPLAKQLGFSQQHFSFNKEGGRCEYCKGEGVTTVEMQFMADIEIECEECHGKRYKEETLEVKFRGKDISEILNLTVSQAVDFFTTYEEDSKYCTEILQGLSALEEVGLGYIRLGQSSSTLSGGENQRIKLASYLSTKGRTDSILFIFDEPTTGLHPYDIQVLMRAFNSLVDHGHTVVIVEHNLDVIKCADYVIDLGPEGGKEGGHLVFEGTPEDLMEVSDSYTGKYLKEKWETEKSQL
ncbi:MAG: excinuclease ABC subunit UvrA [Porphyromonas sp.]|nr:excinuclease ABC subunit UvrA [Porphyromonas sp.]